MLCNSLLPPGSPEIPDVDGQTYDAWDFDVVAQVLSSECQSAQVDWVAVARSLDQGDMVVGDPSTLNTLVALFRRSANMAFPTQALLVPWRNAAAQLSMIGQAVDAPADVVSFAGKGVTVMISPEPGAAEVGQGPPNQAWHCATLVQLLLDMGETEHFAAARVVATVEAGLALEIGRAHV